MKTNTKWPRGLNETPVLALSVTMLALCSCSHPHPLKGGKGFTNRDSTGSFQQSLNQGDNPAQVSRQDQQVIKVRSYTLPAGARIEESRVDALGSGMPVTNRQSILISAPMAVIEREELRAQTELGASQKDTAREIGAKLSSLRGITWAGVVLFLAGLASLAWPPLKAIVGSVTTSAAIMLGGLALAILPTVVVGNELLILGGVALSCGAWFLAHRHGQLRGQLTTYADQAQGSAGSNPQNRATQN